MDIPPDAQIAEYVLNFIGEYLNNQYSSINAASDKLEGRQLVEFKRLSTVAISLSDGIAEMMVAIELRVPESKIQAIFRATDSSVYRGGNKPCILRQGYRSREHHHSLCGC